MTWHCPRPPQKPIPLKGRPWHSAAVVAAAVDVAAAAAAAADVAAAAAAVTAVAAAVRSLNCHSQR